MSPWASSALLAGDAAQCGGSGNPFPIGANGLVEREGAMGELLEAVVAREMGVRDVAPEVAHADEFYLRAVIWANNAAESLYGDVPVGVEVRGLHTDAEMDAPVIILRPEPGRVARFFAAIGRFLRRAI